MTSTQAYVRTCCMCGCTDNDCLGCIERTGQPCHWIAEDLCSACQPELKFAAWRWQSEAIAAGDLLVWIICENPRDYPGQFTAKPHSSRANAPCDFLMVAPTLDSVRSLLPSGLFRLPRDPDDPPVVVESWI